MADNEAERVARFLADNPDWLAAQDGLYERLSPPRRVHGERLADHMAAMIGAARQQAADMAHTAETVLRAGRAALGLSDRVRASVLALIRASDLEEWLSVDLPRLMGVDAALLGIENGRDVAGSAWAERMAGRGLRPGTVALLLGRDAVRVRAAPTDTAALYGEAAPLAVCDALLRVAVAGRRPMLLALAARNDAVLREGLPASVTGTGAGSGGSAALAFLGEALAARLEGPA